MKKKNYKTPKLNAHLFSLEEGIAQSSATLKVDETQHPTVDEWTLEEDQEDIYFNN